MNLHTILWLIPVLLCFSCAEQPVIVEEQDHVEEEAAKGWQKPAVEGDWKFVSVEKVEDTPFLLYYPNPRTPAKEVGPPEPPYIGADLIFENDSMFEISYPKQVVQRTLFSVDSGYLRVHFKWHTELHPIEMVNDTLFIYKPYYGKIYRKEGYVKTSFNDSVIEVMKTHEVNYPELQSTWYLVRFFSAEDGSEPFRLRFPYTIPDSIVISRAQLLNRLNNPNEVFMISTDGEQRDYTYTYSWGDLCFGAGEWCKGDERGMCYTRERQHYEPSDYDYNYEEDDGY